MAGFGPQFCVNCRDIVIGVVRAFINLRQHRKPKFLVKFIQFYIAQAARIVTKCNNIQLRVIH